MRPIDADILRERLQDLAYDDWNQGIIKSFADTCNEIIEIVEEQPTVNAVPVRHGKWINCGTYDQGYQVTLECECCGESVNGYVQDYKFCPYCGAKMEAYEEEEYEEEE